MLPLLCALLLCSHAWDVAKTPPMGWNSWNHFGCGVDADVLTGMAQAMVATGLSDVGYEYINSDDCWMLSERSSSGHQIPNPEKFPDGFVAVTKAIHALGLKSGLYTAKGPRTCAGFAASCDHEYLDAAQWADWGIDYVKDDSCSSCGSKSDDTLYGTMWKAIQASKRPMVLTVEGDPDDSLITKGGYGNAKRVGHDISPHWLSMVSLVDIGSGLWSYAHNSTNATFGGWWNDLDMIEIGNGPDFLCSQDEPSLLRCQAHMSMWCIMKSPLILGNDLRLLSKGDKTLSVLANKDALSVSQDALGVQAKRVAVQMPKNNSIASVNTAVVAVCDTSRPTQKWFWTEVSYPRTSLYVVPCNNTDVFQQWSFKGGMLVNDGNNLCADASAPYDPAELRPCNPKIATQQWTLESTGHVENLSSKDCLDIYNFAGPDVQIYPCKVPGQDDGNQVWSLTSYKQLSNSKSNLCLSAGGSSGAMLSTIDSQGTRRCLSNSFGSEGGWTGLDCSIPNARPTLFTAIPVGRIPAKGPGNYTLSNAQGSPQWNNQPGASGPWPGTRYILGWSWASGQPFELDLQAAKSGVGTTVVASDHLGIINDNLVGKISKGGSFCLDLVSGGMLEVWVAPMTSGRVSVSLFNRSPATDNISLNWSEAGLRGQYSVYNVWDAETKGVYENKYVAAVPALSVAFLILSPK